MTNKEIAHLLRKVAAAYSVVDDKKYYFQIVAYQKSADAIENATSQVTDLIKEKKLEQLPGIGSSIRSHLEELIKKGHVGHFDSILKHVPQSMFPLLDIPGFGPKKAFRLVSEFSLNNPETVITDLKKLAESGKIASIEGFGKKSQADILRGLNEFNNGKTKSHRMLLPFAQELADKMLAYLKQCPYVQQVFPLGSLRRKKPTIGDLDFAVATNKPHEVLEYFTKYPYKVRIIEKGPATSSIVISGGFQIDLMVQPTISFGSLLQHFTGSKDHNVQLRDLALKKKLSLSEKGIKHLDEKNDVIHSYETEESFYHALHVDWIPPELRENTGEIEAAIKHKLPKLIELQDIKGDLHIHSSYPIEPSHDLGVSTFKELVNKALSLKYEYIGFSEHNPSISNHTKSQIYTILSKRNDMIEHIKSSTKNIRIINLLEVDILVNGNLAIDDKSLSLLDAAIVSIHSSFAQNTEEMTQRVLKGLSHPKAKILAHPTGRLLNSRGGYTLQWEKIFAFCKKNYKVLEINAWPERTDLPDSLIKEAIKNDVKLIINTDSHGAEQMDNMRYGVWNARRGWSQKHDILNTLEYNKFIEYINK